MPAASLLALIDDITSVLDDIATLTKVAAKKTAGVLGDDLALNAQQVTGVNANRELPVVWAVAKGSAVNKAILVPAALAISTFAPWGVTPLLMLGGGFLCFEGCEKLAHKFLHHDDQPDAETETVAASPAAKDLAELDPVAVEKNKIRGAVRTDFVLSAEIVVIALGTVSDETLVTRVGVLLGIAIAMTVGVYGLVAGIVKLDDFGLHLTRQPGEGARLQRRVGAGILAAAPYLMKMLSIAGTIAMFLVGGGILAHGIPPIARLAHEAEHALHAIPGIGGVLAAVGPALLNGLVGVVGGALILAVVLAVKKVIAQARRR